MIPSSFEYHKANSVEEAVQLLSNGGDDAKILAGGHSLIPTLKLRLNDPDKLIDISKIDALKSMSVSDGQLNIGAGCTHHQIASYGEMPAGLEMFSEAGHMIGDPQVRNRGTLGGSIAHADPAADWPGILLAANATINVTGPSGERSIPASDFFIALFTTALGEHEIITSVSVPIPAAGTKSTYKKFVQPASRFALVGCAAMAAVADGKCSNVQVAFNGVAAAPFRDGGVESALNGADCNAENVASASSNAASGKTVMQSHFASEKYRSHLAKVYAKKALSAICS